MFPRVVRRGAAPVEAVSQSLGYVIRDKLRQSAMRVGLDREEERAAEGSEATIRGDNVGRDPRIYYGPVYGAKDRRVR